MLFGRCINSGCKKGLPAAIRPNRLAQSEHRPAANLRRHSPQKKTPGIAAGGDRRHLPTEYQGRKLRWMRNAADQTPSFWKV
jgi:hypothetical protein